MSNLRRALEIALLLLVLSIHPEPTLPGIEIVGMEAMPAASIPTVFVEPLFIEADPPTPTAEPTQSWPEVWATQGVDLTAQKTVRRCLRYRVLIDRWNPEFDLDPALVFAVMAQESACYPYTDGTSVGLMQVTPASWTTTRDKLMDPATNIYWGMRILWLTLHDTENNPSEEIRVALAAYNCGWESLHAGKCLSFGGYAYADTVLNFWLPYVQEAMK